MNMSTLLDDPIDKYKNYNIDSKVAFKTEKEVAELLLKHYGWKTIKFNGNNKYDLLVIKNKKKIKIEVKEDFTCQRTGNIGLEFECRGLPSGISVSESTHYLYKAHTRLGVVYLLIRTEVLKQMIENHEYHRIISGGDKGSNSMNYLFKYDVIKRKSRMLFIEKEIVK